MKIIFLDMDGVMNSHQSIHFFHDFMGLKSNWFQKYLPSDMEMFNHYEDEICPMAVSNMRTLLKNHPDIRFVISSTWRLGRDEAWFEKLFNHIGILGDNHCMYCDGEGKYSSGTPCNKCETTGTQTCPLKGQTAVIGRTPKLHMERGHEIQKWLDDNKDKYDIENFVILDDDGDMEHFIGTPNFIQTDGRVGFDYIKMEEVDKIFEGFTIKRDEVQPNTGYLMFGKPRDVVYYYDDVKNQFYYYSKEGELRDNVYCPASEVFAKAKK